MHTTWLKRKSLGSSSINYPLPTLTEEQLEAATPKLVVWYHVLQDQGRVGIAVHRFVVDAHGDN